MEPVLKAGIAGVAIAFVITLFFAQENLYFIPSFVASIVVIYLFELKATKDAVLAAFITYIFTDWIFNGIPILLSMNETFTFTFTVDAWMVIGQLFAPITALLAGLCGAEMAKTRRRTTPTLQPPPPPPPQPQPLASPQVAPSTQTAETKFCRYCGEGNKTDAVFCERCGRRIA